MGKIIELSHDDVQNELAYALICETMEGAYWNSGRRRRMFSKAFTRSEQQRISNIKAKTLKGVCIMNKTVPTIEMNPIDDIQHLLEESSCYESEIEMMKTAGTYDVFVRKVHDAIDWGYLCTQMTELENNTIAAAIDKVHGMTTKTEDDA